jgi:hypothetical protein
MQNIKETIASACINKIDSSLLIEKNQFPLMLSDLKSGPSSTSINVGFEQVPKKDKSKN